MYRPHLCFVSKYKTLTVTPCSLQLVAHIVICCPI